MSALPAEFDYNVLKPSVAPANGMTARLFPEAGTEFTGGQIITFHLPAGKAGQYLRGTETSLFFKVENSGATGAGNAAEFCGGAYSCIQKISIFHGANLISEVHDYNCLHALLYDTTASREYRTSVGAMLHGTAPTAAQEAAANALKGASISALTGTTPGVYYAAVQIISPLIGTMSERMLPLGLMSSDLIVQIELSADATAFVSAGTPVIKYKEVELHTQIVQLDPSVDQAISSDPSGVLSFHSADFRTFTHSVASGTTFAVQQIPMRYSSLNYALHVFRPSTNLADMTKRSVDGRTKNKLTKAQYRLGATLAPQRPVDISNDNLAPIVIELLKTQGKLETLGSEMGMIFADRTLFTNDDTTGGTTQGTFAMAIDLTPFSGSLDDLSNGGINTISQPIALEMTFNETTYDARMTTFANFSTLYVLDLQNGTLDVRM